ncbi:hypothetical protein JZU48_05470, partial [bacterium]|nr:hypothetical protein [bacterium]
MAVTIKGAAVHIYGDWDGSGVKQAQRDISVFGKQAQGFSSGFSKSMLGVGAAIGGAFAVTNIASQVMQFFGDSMQAAMDEEKAIRSLEIALGNVGQASQLGAAEDGIKRLSKMAAVADDDLRPAMQT